MSILIDRDTRALIQGGTGAVGSFQIRLMLEYGTNIVCAVTPGKGGQEVHGVPVYDFVRDAVKDHAPNAALSFVPAPFVYDAAVEGIEAGIPLLVICAEGVADRDMLSILRLAQASRTRVIGPDTPGLIAPGKCKLGVHPNRMFTQGPIGVVSKSGALSYEVCKTLTESGIGQSTVVGIGGGPTWGLSQAAVIEMFERDPQTSAIVLLGEVGGRMEIEAARFIRDRASKPVIAMVVGLVAPPGARMGHAGAIVEGEEGTAQRKIDVLRASGAQIARRPGDIAELILEMGI